ncbi:MAG: peptidase [Planctomycetota bacterium]
MTFCLAMNVEDGIVGLSDTRVTTGSEVISSKKVSLHEFPPLAEDAPARATHGDKPAGSCFVMTSGLRGARDKALTYFEDEIARPGREPEMRLFEVANLLAAQIRKVSNEDREALRTAGFDLNIHALIGGQMYGDERHRLFLLYPEGNWVSIERDTPYQIIGAGGYGKPVLDRTLKYEDPMRFALKVGCLAFDSTRISAADVGPPIDVVLYKRDGFRTVEHRFQQSDLAEITDWWQDRLRNSIRSIPSGWIAPLRDELPPEWGDVLEARSPDRYGP